MRLLIVAAALLSACAKPPAPPPPPPPPAVSNPELSRLYEADQQDRTNPSEGSIMDRDAERRRAVDALLARGEAKTSEDYFHAAMVFQHGNEPAEIDRAHALALRATTISPTHPKARWLAAASEDRAHMYRGEPQRFGTQFRVEHGVWVLYQTDPQVTDEERARWGVPPIAEARARVGELNRTAPGGVFSLPETDAGRHDSSDYKAIGGTETCISCHMPVMAGLKQVVDGANNPDRDVHDHSFVGVDYALDDVTQRDATRAARTALLQGAARLAVDPTTLGFDGTNVSLQVTVTNSGTGHNLPTGFAFVRQMWLEVTALDAGGAVLASSGLLAAPSDDLCESEVLGDTQSPLSTFVTGCPGGTADPGLVHFQLKLVDSVEIAPDAQGNPVKDQLGQPLLRGTAASREVLLQLLPGGVIARKRPADGAALPTLRPFESRTFPYKLPTGGATPTSVAVRLLFRNAPPYFVRGLAAAQPQDVPNLASLVNNLEIVEMARTTAAL